MSEKKISDEIQFQKTRMRYQTLFHLIFFLKKFYIKYAWKYASFKNRINISMP